ncbi:hypothetical protein NEH83_10700 [Streptomyces sp. JUS-F4]|uniref:hypothetical protein n=1 Tax=Streptomyces TaxID=1883 RepID=UPI002665A047|nr:hypothetical protein [Streptomyces sp. JUS-F4]WKN14645.1 hypothetical protein NEH83_10700 [Streptomyces sp. JUS-F4]
MSRPVQGGLTVTALVFVPLLAVAGSDELRATLDFTTGVLSLVSLSAAVAWGLLATDRLFLSTRQRIVCQGIHRATAVASLGFLLLHGTVKVALGHVALIGALIPFGLGVTGTAGLIGFGSLAGLLMVVTAATGALRSAFAQPSPKAARLGQSLASPRDTGGIAGRWRALHALAYPAWCAALIHGLYAGRPPATWVVVMYGLCLAGVAGALCVRLLPRPTKRRIADRISELLGEGPPAAPDPVLRESSSAGAEPWSDPAAWSEPDRDLRGTPVRPRTLSAPIPPAGPPPTAIPGGLHEAPTETLYGSRSPLYEPPPRSADRIAFGPPENREDLTELSEPSGRGQGKTPGQGPGPRLGTGPGIAAGYRAVSLGGGPSLPPESRWPAPSPAPPEQAQHGPPGQEPPTYTPQEHTYATPSYSTPEYGTPEHGTPTYEASEYSYSSPSYGPPGHESSSVGTPEHGSPSVGTSEHGSPSVGTPEYGGGTPAAYSPPAEPSSSPVASQEPAPASGPGHNATAPFTPPFPSPSPSPFAAPRAEPEAGPFSAPPAGEPWHAPAGDRQ